MISICGSPSNLGMKENLFTLFLVESFIAKISKSYAIKSNCNVHHDN